MCLTMLVCQQRTIQATHDFCVEGYLLGLPDYQNCFDMAIELTAVQAWKSWCVALQLKGLLLAICF